eukprot:a514143_64.p1 GENE.a514143_64~~a514143_64.p1  ORF type:complete len:441 (-),score=158.62 a514143_64:20-1228(-)
MAAEKMDLRGLTALVTGGAGFIGSHVVDACVAAGMRVKVLDNMTTRVHMSKERPPYMPAEVEFIVGSTTSRAAWESALVGVDVVFHLAACGAAEQMSEIMEDNAFGTALMFDVIRAHALPVRKIISASSQAVYGEGRYHSEAKGEFCFGDLGASAALRPLDRLERREWEVPCPVTGVACTAARVPETQYLFPASAYAISKLSCEQLTIVLGRQMGIPTAAMRFALTYGPRQSVSNVYSGIVSIFSTLLVNGRSPTIYEDGEQSRDFLFVADNVAAQMFIMQDPRCCWEVYNVCTGVGSTINALASHLAELYGVPHLRGNYTGAFRPWDARHLVLSPAKLEALGWRAQVSMRDGVARHVEWIKSLGPVQDYFSAAAERLRLANFVCETAPKDSETAAAAPASL